MHGVFFLSALILLSLQGPTSCLRIKEIRVPGHVAEGSDATLVCKFNLEGHRLYAVKWLKDRQEFYNIKPWSNNTSVPAAHTFSVRGVTVDLARSNLNTVTLLYMSLESAGQYCCEVTSEGPDFTKVAMSRNLTVDLLPERGPVVTGLKEYYKVNQPLELNCTSVGARPASSVEWYVNGALAQVYHTRGPWYSRSVNRVDAIDTTMELSFGVLGLHFPHGVMTLKCVASLEPLYNKEVVYRYQLLPFSRQGKQIETTSMRTVKTTEKPCVSTIKVDVAQPSALLETWPVDSSSEGEPDSAGFLKNSALLLFICISLGVLL